MPTITKLEELAEQERCAGHRQKFLGLKKKIEIQKQEEVLAMHNACLEQAKKEFKIGSYIPELQGSVKEIKDGCGTQRGWIEIYLDNREKPLSPLEMYKAIACAKASKAANERFSKLKLSDKKKDILIGKHFSDTLDDLILEMSLDLPDSETIDNWSIDSYYETYNYILKQAKEDGFTDEEAEEKGREAEDEARSDDFEEYQQSIIRTINYLLNFHGMELVDKGKYYAIHLTAETWHEVADKVASTISGYGMFEYANGKEFRDVGPYKSYCEAVFNHLHWLKRYPEVYGERGYRSVYER